MKGMLIAIEGLDGSGKTTQIEKLKNWLLDIGLKVHITKQPTDFYRNDKRVRDYLDYGIAPNMYSLALLAAADRTYQISTEFMPKLTDGYCIISDRYIYSSLAFFKARGLEYSEIEQLNRNVIKPDIAMFLDIPPVNALQRVRQRDGKNIKFEEKGEFVFVNVRENFLEVLPKDSLIIDSTQDVELVHHEIISFVKNKLK